MHDELAVEAIGLEKSYGACGSWTASTWAVAGTVLALLGPNGKTTAVRILATLIRADAGQVRVAASTSSPTAARCAASASPASSRPWTTSRPARRTCA